MAALPAHRPIGLRATRPSGAASSRHCTPRSPAPFAIPFGNEEFKLIVRADRIECLADGRYAILDYKTGAPPTAKQVRAGLAPQLTLEAAILRQGGFDGVPGQLGGAALVCAALRRRARPAKNVRSSSTGRHADEHADQALVKLTELLTQVRRP